MPERELSDEPAHPGGTGLDQAPRQKSVEASETGTLGVLHLRRLWSRALAVRQGQPAAEAEKDWLFDQILLSGLHLALEETMQYLYQSGPSFEEFERWILDRNNGQVEPERVERINRTIQGLDPSPRQHAVIQEIENAEPALTEEELQFWDEQGYVVVRRAVSPEESQAAAEALWLRFGMKLDDPESWYQIRQGHGIMMQFFHHPALQRIRESPRIHKAFAQIWGTADLWATTDRVSFNPPERPGWMFPGPRLHWDTSLELPIPFGVQGLLYLTDTAAEQGAFTCVPGFHRKIHEWLDSLPSGTSPREQDMEKLGAIPIAASAGDLVIWHQALPHGSRPNRGERPRLVQYLTMFPPIGEAKRNWQ
jgi:hypothetical protein